MDVYTFAQPENQQFVGAANYIELFTDINSIMTKSITNTLIFTVGSIFFQFIPASNEPSDCLQAFGDCREGQRPRSSAALQI